MRVSRRSLRSTVLGESHLLFPQKLQFEDLPPGQILQGAENGAVLENAGQAMKAADLQARGRVDGEIEGGGGPGGQCDAGGIRGMQEPGQLTPALIQDIGPRTEPRLLGKGGQRFLHAGMDRGRLGMARECVVQVDRGRFGRPLPGLSPCHGQSALDPRLRRSRRVGHGVRSPLLPWLTERQVAPFRAAREASARRTPLLDHGKPYTREIGRCWRIREGNVNRRGRMRRRPRISPAPVRRSRPLLPLPSCPPAIPGTGFRRDARDRRRSPARAGRERPLHRDRG